MAYSVKKTDETQTPIIIRDREVNTSTSLDLLGKNVPSYGESVASNFVRLLENFSSPDSPPRNPIIGQLWWHYDNVANIEVLKIYTDNLSVQDGGTTTGWKPLNPPLTRVKNVNQNYTVNESDHGFYIRIDSSTAKQVILPNISSIPIGTTVTIVRAGLGSVTINSANGSIVEPSRVLNKSIENQFGRVTVIKVAQTETTATWDTDFEAIERISVSPVSATWSIGNNQSISVSPSSATWNVIKPA